MFMAPQIIETPFPESRWSRLLGEPAAQHLLGWQQASADRLLADVFGYHALQVGQCAPDLLRANRMPHRWHAHVESDSATPADEQADLVMDTRAWPWSAASLDLVVLPHTLEWSADPHLCLRELERVLMPEGRALISGLQPWRPWSACARGQTSDHWPLQPIALGRLRDWLRLLDFEVEAVALGGWLPPLRSEGALQRLAGIERLGRRWLPWLAGYYMVLAAKRVAGVHWRAGRVRQALPSRRFRAVPVAGSQSLRDPLHDLSDASN